MYEPTFAELTVIPFPQTPTLQVKEDTILNTGNATPFARTHASKQATNYICTFSTQAGQKNANAMRRHPSQGPSRRVPRPATYRLQCDQRARERTEQSNQSNDAEPLVFSLLKRPVGCSVGCESLPDVHAGVCTRASRSRLDDLSCGTGLAGECVALGLRSRWSGLEAVGVRCLGRAFASACRCQKVPAGLVSTMVLDLYLSAVVDMHEDVRRYSARLQRVQNVSGNHIVLAPERRLPAFITCDPSSMCIIILSTLIKYRRLY
jgi:hypothetical protein